LTTAADINPPPRTNIGDVIRLAREGKRMTQAELGLAIGVTSRTIGSYERGVIEPPLGLVPVIGQALGVRFVDDGTGHFRADDPAPEPAPAPQVVVLNASTAEAVEAAFKWLGVPKAE
jgi:transcriptional regulator with XRE-family HTH domain